MKKILFVCTANICRSPMAAALLDALAEERGIEVSAGSAGVAALVGEPAAPYARQALEEMGLDAGSHRARQVDRDLLARADLVLTMTPQHRDALRRNFGDMSGKIQTLPEYVGGDPFEGIADPYGHGPGTYRASLREILGYVEELLERLRREEKEKRPR